MIFGGLLFIMTGCNRHAKRKECISHLRNARNDYYEFFQGHDSTLLEAMVAAADSALTCPETRVAAVEAKLQALATARRFDQGARFVDSLAPGDFRSPYGKELDSAYFRAKSWEAKGDTVKGKKIFAGLDVDFTAYVNKHRLPGNRFDTLSLSTLLFIKSQYLDKRQFDSIVDSIKARYPESGAFLDDIVGSMFDNYVSSDSVRMN